jgi:hypothetical protein
MGIAISTCRRLSLTALVAAFLIAGCSAMSNPEQPGQNVTIRGRLTDEGVECPALRSEDDKLYTLVGDLKGARRGDRVVVEGTVAEVSTCMQGITIQIKKIEKVS